MKKIIFVITIIVVMLICFVGCGSEDSSSSDSGNNVVTESYVDDETINTFINVYNTNNEKAITQIQELAVSGYSCEINGYYSTIESINDMGIEVNIHADSDKPEMAELEDEFCNIVKALDSNVDIEELKTKYSEIIAGKYIAENQSVGDVKIAFYPTTDSALGHLTLSVDDYSVE